MPVPVDHVVPGVAAVKARIYPNSLEEARRSYRPYRTFPGSPAKARPIGASAAAVGIACRRPEALHQGHHPAHPWARAVGLESGVQIGVDFPVAGTRKPRRPQARGETSSGRGPVVHRGGLEEGWDTLSGEPLHPAPIPRLGSSAYLRRSSRTLSDLRVRPATSVEIPSTRLRDAEVPGSNPGSPSAKSRYEGCTRTPRLAPGSAIPRAERFLRPSVVAPHAEDHGGAQAVDATSAARRDRSRLRAPHHLWAIGGRCADRGPDEGLRIAADGPGRSLLRA